MHHTAASFDYHPYGSLHVSVCHPFFFFLISAESRLFLSLPCPHSLRVALPSPWTLLHRVAGNEVSQPAQGTIFNCYLSSVTNVTAPGMWKAVSHAFMHKHTVRTRTSRQTVSDAYKLHVLAYNQPHSDQGMIEMSCTRLNQFAGLVEN